MILFNNLSLMQHDIYVIESQASINCRVNSSRVIPIARELSINSQGDADTGICGSADTLGTPLPRSIHRNIAGKEAQTKRISVSVAP